MWVDATLDFEFEGHFQCHKVKIGLVRFCMYLGHIDQIYPEKVYL